MRLWHKDLIPVLPDMQLRGQWRECCLIAKELHDGKLNHLLVNRVKEYPIEHFFGYCGRVFAVMIDRGFRTDSSKLLQYAEESDWWGFSNAFWNAGTIPTCDLFDGWHNDRYLLQCLYNLQEKHDCGGIPDSEWARIVEKFPQID